MVDKEIESGSSEDVNDPMDRKDFKRKSFGTGTSRKRTARKRQMTVSGHIHRKDV